MKKICFLIVAILTLSTVSFANLQSRPDRTRLVSQTANQFFIKARNMEAPGGVLGKQASIDQETGGEASSSNNIDAHMCKNTEYGAAAILSVSQYGYSEKVPETSGIYNASNNTYTLGDSTTGAAGTESYYYGLFDMSNNWQENNNYKYTYTATAHRNTKTTDTTYQYSSILYRAARDNTLSKYVDFYPNQSNGNITYYYGDATLETPKWRGASNSYSVIATYPLLFRSKGIFGRNNRYGDSSSEFATRVGVVCGAGL